MTRTLLTNIGRLFTSSERGAVDDAAVVIEGDAIAWAGPRGDLPGNTQVDAEHDVDGALVTPGLVDAHTHPVYAGARFAEIAARTAGASYAELAAAGGGIASTVRATRNASQEDLALQAGERFRSWLRSGTTTVEAKTGYKLDRDGEIATVELLRGLDGPAPIPRVEITFLAAHAVGPEFEGRRSDYANEAAGWSKDAAAAGARFCDVFCDAGYFTVDESRIVLEAGREAGLIPRIHADELEHTGGAKLAAAVGAASADHLLHVDDSDAKALAEAGVVATLAPITALSMGTMPDARMLLDRGVTIALGTDHNPGTSGSTDMTVVIALAVAAFDLSVEEALIAATRGGAVSLKRDDVGVIAPGAKADLVAWDADHEGAFAWAFGVRPRDIWLAGTSVLTD